MRLLAVNLNYMGDALFTTPALASLRNRFPNAHIDVLAGERAAAILEGNHSLNQLILRPPHGGSGRAVALARTLRAGQYDAVVMFQSTLSNALLAWTAGVPIRVGFAQEGCAPLLTKVVDVRRPGEHDVDAYLRLVNALDSTETFDAAAQFRLKVSLSAEDIAFADRFFTTHELMPPVIGLVIGATRAQKRWPEEYFARLADKLYDIAGISCVLLGGHEEGESAARILSLTRRAPVISAIGATTEKQLAALIDRLGVVVSGDSGPLHIATAMTTPFVALFGSTDPADTGPWISAQDGTPSGTILYDALSCAPCRKNPTCDGRFDCMRALTPERVFDAVVALLKSPATRAQRMLLPVVGSNTALPPAAPRKPVARAPKSQQIRSVLVVTKHRFMGDTIVAVPLLRAARQAYPKARIVLLTGSDAAVALENCPYDIEIVTHSKETGARTAAGSARLTISLVRRMFDLLTHNRPDLCLIADRSFRTAAAARVCGGKIRAGFDTEGRGWLLTNPIPYDSERPETECCLDILRAITPERLGAPPYDPTPELWTTEEERQNGRAILAASGALTPVSFEGQLVGIQPGASLGDRKQWLPERFGSVAKRLAAEGARIVLIGYGEDEEKAAAQMIAAMGSHVPVIDLTSKTKLRETMGVLTQLSLFVGNDTGINHIASALGVPTVALFGPTPAQKWAHTGPLNRVLVATGGDMSTIPASDVFDAAQDLLFAPRPTDVLARIDATPSVVGVAG